MTLVWKLLRRHISVPQFAGFFFANLLGMLIVLLSLQFYCDVAPVFTQGDSFIKKDYLIISKRISMVSSFSGRSSTFSADDIDEIRSQKFCKSVGVFTSSQYNVSASMGVEGMAAMSTDMFFESVPDSYVDVGMKDWHFREGDPVVPIILPRSYLTIYNFGFAQSRSLPKLFEGVVSMLDLNVRLRGNGREDVMKGKVIGFSNRLNTILVPEEFMRWSNARYAPGADTAPTRLIVEVNNSTDDAIARFLQKKGYDTENDKLDAGKTTYFLKIVSGVVMTVGLLISILSFYILMLSIYLLVQKNTTKLENLLLIGYSPWRVALPYQLLTIGLNVLVFLLAVGFLSLVRDYYLNMILLLFPQMKEAGMWPAFALGIVLCVAVSVLNIAVIHAKILSIWKHKG
ncbi:MAG: ABC transporter permease [Paraprevotella sp.]|nr:ABC transporter permease [Paraprevotella sp.]